MRKSDFFSSNCSASISYPGAMITSVKIVETCFAISSVTIRFAAITPPYAEIESHMCALA